jgi:long-chain acyl-CoA synthetase
VLERIEFELNKYRKGGEYEELFPQRWLPSSIAIIPEGFTEENHLMNSTMKMVRPKINERFNDLLESLYLPDAKNIKNTYNRGIINQIIA